MTSTERNRTSLGRPSPLCPHEHAVSSLQFGSERRETTITDEIVADLRRRGRGLLYVAPAPGPESRYGADIELWLRGGGYLLGMLMQAKALHPRKRSDGVYGHLHHVIGQGATARNQVDTLISATRAPLTPMYLYYNGLAKKPAVQSGCGSKNGFAEKNGRLGLTASSATLVKWMLDHGRRRTLADILPHSVPVQCLVACECPMASLPEAALPLRAAEWPLTRVASYSPWLVPDPVHPPDEEELELLRRSGVRLYDGDLPSYVIQLAQTQRLPQDARPQARYVVLVDGDAWDGEDLIDAFFGDG